MDAERWKRTRALFEEAAELPADQWDAYLARACDDPDIAVEVRGLLQADAEAASRTSLSEQAPDLFAGLKVDDDSEDARQRLGQRYGAWRLVRALAEGGMGVVYLAERVEGDFTQRAALKVVRNAASSADVLTRFRYERQILANLSHPNIARLLDGGAGQGGEPYLAMEYVEGSDLRSYCDGKALDIDARLRLFLTVCDAVAYAHDRLVLHRDLKPANVLVSKDGEVKLLDFGVAKLIDQQQPAETTVAGRQVFTPEYAAPEQIRGEISTVAVDVYALGVMLYELLTGRRPYRIRGRGAAAIERAVLSTDAPPPSTLTMRDGDRHEKSATEYAVVRGTTPDRLRHQLRGDLDAIVLHALRKTPQERYPTVKAFADDLRAYLQRRPVLARRGSRRYRAARFVQRHAAAIALGSIASLSLIAGSMVALWQAREARIQRDAAIAAQKVSDKEALKSRTTLTFMNRLFEQADPSRTRGDTLTAREILGKGATQIREDTTTPPDVRAEMMTAIGKAQIGLGLLDDALPLLQEAAQLNRDALVPHVDTSIAYATALARLGRPQETLPVLETLRERLLAADGVPPETLSRVDQALGSIYQRLQRMEESQAAFLRALKVEEAVLGIHHRETQGTLLSLADSASMMGRNDEARAMAERVVSALRDSANRDPDFHAIALQTLARTHANDGDPTAAEPLLRESLQIQTGLYGVEHSRTMSVTESLAGVLSELGRTGEAVELYERTLRFNQAKFGPDSTAVARSEVYFANTLLKAARPAEALPLASDALRIHLQHYGENHFMTALSLQAQGMARLDLGSHDEARALLKRALAAFEPTAGTESLYIVESLTSLTVAEMLGDVGDHDCEPAERAARIIDAHAFPTRPESIYRRAVADACLARDDSAGTMAALQASLAALQRSGTGQPRWTRTLKALIERLAPAH